MKIGIVGSNVTTRHLAPFGDPSWQLWSMNNLFVNFPGVQWARWFEIHIIEKIDNHWLRRESKTFRNETVDNYINDLCSLPCPVYMHKQWIEIPNSIEYPLDLVKANFRRIFKGSVSYMLALAILERPEKIGLWGVDLSSTTEYAEQKPSTWYLLGLAEGRGIELVIPDESDLLKVRSLYGFEDEKEDIYTKKLKAMITAAEQQMAQATNDRLNAIRIEQEMAGALQVLRRIPEIWK